MPTLHYDPLPPLLAAPNPALVYQARRDLLHAAVPPRQTLWELPEPCSLFRRQLPDGSWKYPGRGPELRSYEDYPQLETYRNLAILIEKYGLDFRHPGIERAGEFLFSRQTPQGDFRGVYGSQYSPNYTGQILELLVKAGWQSDPRVERAFQWLQSMRQADGGWAIPLRTQRANFKADVLRGQTLELDPARPASHLITGCVLRAFAAHPLYRSSPEAKTAGELLAGRIFQPDTYPDRREPVYWTAFSFPFWMTDILSALDTLSAMGFDRRHPGLQPALAWLIDQQQPDGGWKLKLLRGKDKELPLWLGLAISRVLGQLGIEWRQL